MFITSHPPLVALSCVHYLGTARREGVRGQGGAAPGRAGRAVSLPLVREIRSASGIETDDINTVSVMFVRC